MSELQEKELTDLRELPRDARRTPLEQAKEATDLAREAFACGDMVTGIAAITLAAQLVQLARIWERADAK